MKGILVLWDHHMPFGLNIFDLLYFENHGGCLIRKASTDKLVQHRYLVSRWISGITREDKIKKYYYHCATVQVDVPIHHEMREYSEML